MNFEMAPEVIEEMKRREAQLLGDILLRPAVMDRVYEAITEKDFYSPPHAVIYGAMHAIYGRGKLPEGIEVVEELRRSKKLRSVGGIAQIAYLENLMPTVAGIESDIRHVRENSLYRRVMEILRAKAADVAVKAMPMGDILASLQEDLSRLQLGAVAGEEPNAIGDVLDFIEKFNADCENPDLSGGLDTPFVDLNELTGGMYNGQFIVVAGRPGMGKSAFALNIATFMAKVRPALIKKGIQPKRVLFFSLEMTKEQLFNRALSFKTGIKAQLVRDRKYLTAEQRDACMEQLLREANWKNLFLVDNVRDIRSIQSLAHRLTAKMRSQDAKSSGGGDDGHSKGIDLIIVDYIQLVEPSEHSRKLVRSDQVQEVSRSLKALALSLNVPVIGLSQLNRNVETRSDKRPVLSDLRESGSIEQDADAVWFLFRPGYYADEEGEDTGIDVNENGFAEAEVIVAKSRDGRLGRVSLWFDPDRVYFRTKERRGKADLSVE